MLCYIVILISYGCLVKCQTCRQVNETQVDCSHLNLTRVPKNLPSNTTQLDLSNNSITILYNGDFKHLNQLKILNLGENPLSSIQSLAFEGLWSLQSLLMIGHELNYTTDALPDDVFEPLRSLVTLAIRSDMERFGRKYPIIRDKPFGKLINLIDLNIDTTPRIVFGFEFSNMKKLQSLKVRKEGDFQAGLSKVTNVTFTNFSTTVETINFDSCNLTVFESGSLLPFPFLKTFQVNGVTFGKGSLNDIISALSVYEGKTISTIAINKLYADSKYATQLYRLTGHVIGNICVENLHLAHNQLVEIDFDSGLLHPSLFTKCIKSFDLHDNRLYGKISKISLMQLGRLTNLEKVLLSRPRRYDVGDFDFGESKDMSGFTVPIPFWLPPKLSYIDVSGLIYYFGELMDLNVFGGENMRYLNISYFGIHNLNCSIHGLDNLETLDVSFNKLNVISLYFFKDFPNLKTLRLSGCVLDSKFLLLNGKMLFTPLTRLTFLDLSQNDLVLLSDDIFKPLHNIEEIVLTNTKLIRIPDVSSLPHLQHLCFGHNFLTTLNQDTRQMLERTSRANSNFSLSIYGNIFSCSCSSIELLIWLNETLVALDGRDYTCIGEHGELTTTASVFEDLVSINRRCRSPFWFIIALSSFFVTIVCIISFFVVVKNRMKIRLFLFRMLGHNIYPRERHEFKYDLSIFHDESYYCLRFVQNELQNELSTTRGINVNLDLGHLGHPTYIAVAEDIRDSWKIVLVITERFLNSDVCLFTMCNCLSAITLTTPNRILLFIDGQPIIPKNVHFFMDSIAEENIFYVDLSNPLGNEFWTDFTRHLLREEIRD